MDINQGFGSGQTPPAPSDTGQAQEPPQIDPNYQITFDPMGRPMELPQQAPVAETPAPEPEKPADAQTVSAEDFRRFQSLKDREVAAARQQAEALQRQLEALQQQQYADQQAAELQRRLDEAPTAAERERIRLAAEQERLEAQQAQMAEVQWVQTQEANLADWEQEYASTVGLSDMAIRAMNAAVYEAVQNEVRQGLPREQYYSRIHTLREQAVRGMLVAAQSGNVPPGTFRNQPNPQAQAQQAPQQYQQPPAAPPQQQYQQQAPQAQQAGAVPYQPVARPAFAPSGVPAADALLGQWARTHDPNDYEKLARHYNLPR